MQLCPDPSGMLQKGQSVSQCTDACTVTVQHSRDVTCRCHSHCFAGFPGRGAHSFGTRWTLCEVCRWCVQVPVGRDFRLAAAAVRRALTRNTALVVASAPCFPHGVVDDVAGIAEARCPAAPPTTLRSLLVALSAIAGWARSGAAGSAADMLQCGLRSTELGWACPHSSARSSVAGAWCVWQLISSAPCRDKLLQLYPGATRSGPLPQVARRAGAWCHVDACLGGFVLPFARQLGHAVPAFDFAVPGVSSMSVDTHKFGMAHKARTSPLLLSIPAAWAGLLQQCAKHDDGMYAWCWALPTGGRTKLSYQLRPVKPSYLHVAVHSQ